MTDRDFERGRDWQMGRSNQGNGFRTAPGPGDQSSQQGTYGSEGFAGREQFGNQFGAGHGQGYGGPNVGWQESQPQGQPFSGGRQTGGWEGGYGTASGYGFGARGAEGYGAPGFAGQGWGEQSEAWRHSRGHQPWEHGYSGHGFWGQGHPGGTQQEFGGQGTWGGQYGQGFAGQPGSWQGGMGPGQPEFGRQWSQGPANQFGDQGYAGQPGGAMGPHTGESWFAPGPFSGRGPRGYQRSDARIEEDIYERLTQHGQLDATDIEVKVENGEVTLTGSAESRHAKRLAEDILDSISGVQDVHNELRVQQRSGEADWGQTDSASGRSKTGGQSGRNEKAMAGTTRG